METAPELARLFPPVVRAWLAARGCEEARWVPAGERPPAPEGCAVFDFPLDLPGSPLRWLVLRLRFAPGASLSPDDRARIGTYLGGLAPFLVGWSPASRDPWVTLSRETLLVVEHQVRNFLNSLLMNAAVLSLHAGHEGPDPVLEQIESDGQRCLDVVRQLLHPPG